ncbi:transposase-like protein [Pseudarthrobacter siccitolerans]|uniref:Transposase-like protein n=1 Tax=Pseudarthrobacter siccitolerans TaxID=861266 RepID=A0ABU0PHJ5_9MICC|nr:transposase-like protein [Pseudarthrobacter siccitolerans]
MAASVAAAQQLGVGKETVRRWVVQAQIDNRDRPANPAPSQRTDVLLSHSPSTIRFERTSLASETQGSPAE